MKSDTEPLKDEKGQGIIEYATILMLVAAASVAALTALGSQVVTLYTTVINVWP
ncbi:MAG: hypothetical protein WA666_11135 [Nitrospirota bacterium]